jgi:hypothetical protein
MTDVIGRSTDDGASGLHESPLGEAPTIEGFGLQEESPSAFASIRAHGLARS